jgi:hypothetical protein
MSGVMGYAAGVRRVYRPAERTVAVMMLVEEGKIR